MEKEVLSLNPSWLEWPAKQWSQILDKIICLKEMYTREHNSWDTEMKTTVFLMTLCVSN